VKKLLAVLGLATVVSGCAVAAEINNQFGNSAAGVPFMMVRSITLDKNGSPQISNVVVWSLLGGNGGSLTALTRSEDGGTPHAVQDVNTSKSLYVDTQGLMPGVNYTYTSTFTGGKTLTRSVSPYGTSDTGTVVALSPVSDLIQAQIATTSTQPTLSWSVSTSAKPNGFLVSVAEAPLSAGSADELGSSPVYTAFLDYSTHPEGAKLGDVTDIKGMSTELREGLGNLDPRFQATGSADVQLESGKSYMWVVAPLKFDAEQTCVAIGTQAFGLFQVP